MVRFLKKLDEDRLKSFALLFMEDCYQICNVAHYQSQLNAAHTKFNLSLRQFRHQHPWLQKNILATDTFDKLEDPERTIVYGVRYAPDTDKPTVAMVGNWEGEPITLNIEELLKVKRDRLQVAIATPGLIVEDLSSVTLANSQSLLLTANETD